MCPGAESRLPSRQQFFCSDNAMPDDEFIAGRLRWRASKHGLPSHEFDHAPGTLCSSIRDKCDGYDVGLFVLVFGNTPDKWTAIGTRAAMSYYDGAVHHCPLSQIVAFDPATPLVKKQDMECLDVTLIDSSTVRLWGPRGPQFFAMWNILLGVSRMNLADNSQ